MPRFLRRWLVLLGLLALSGVMRAATPGWWGALGVRDLSGAVLQAPGRWLVLVFVSPECPVANADIPVLNALAAEFGPRDFTFVGVYSDPALELSALRRHAANFQAGFLAADDRAQRLVRTTGATYTPETFVFSSDDGRLIYRGRIDDRVEDFGPARPVATHEDLREVLLALVAGRAVPFNERPGFGCAIVASAPK